MPAHPGPRVNAGRAQPRGSGTSEEVGYSRAVPRRGILCAALAVTSVTALAACSGGGSSGLQAALGRIANTSGNRSQIWYDDTAELVKLAGASPASAKGFAPLRGIGTSGLVSIAAELAGQTGIKVFGEDYSISAGSPPAAVSLISGGQNASQTASDLTKLGWVKQGSTLLAPSLASTGGNDLTGTLSVYLGRVSDSGGSDLVFGGRGADLGQAGSPSGRTLAQDPVIGALASCLGNVVAAWIGTYDAGPQLRPAPSEVAVGVLTPASNASVPQAVACTSWPSTTAAGTYQRNLSRALTSGMSFSRGQRFSSLLTQPQVRDVGGPEHVIAWQAGTPGDSQLAFQLVESTDLPGLPDCQRIPPSDWGQYPGCPS
jgi:hypothetical protein